MRKKLIFMLPLIWLASAVTDAPLLSAQGAASNAGYICIADVYYIGEVDKQLDDKQVPFDKIEYNEPSFGRLSFSKMAIIYESKVSKDVGIYADRFVCESKTVSKIRFYKDNTMIGIRTSGSILGKLSGGESVFFYCKAGFNKQQILSFFTSNQAGNQ